MKRVNLRNVNDFENLIYHLTRYKFVARILSKKDIVIEIGCGHGYGTYFLSKYCQKIVGIDIDSDIINQCKKEYGSKNLDFKCLNILDTDITKFPKYDVVVCFEVIEHMNRKEAYKLMEKLKDLKKDDGIIFLSTPRRIEDKFKTENRRKFHMHEYTYEELNEDLSKIFSRFIILGQLDEIIGSLNPNNVWTYFCICW